jgi:putative lipoic acid-binding regulatory protein
VALDLPQFGDGTGDGDLGPVQIEYPADWSYHVIGADPDALQAAVARAVADAEHRFVGGATSRGSRWHSVRVRVRVEDEPHRLGILAALQADAAVRLVL